MRPESRACLAASAGLADITVFFAPADAVLEESFAPADVVLAELFVPADVVLAELFAPADVVLAEPFTFVLADFSPAVWSLSAKST